VVHLFSRLLFANDAAEDDRTIFLASHVIAAGRGDKDGSMTRNVSALTAVRSSLLTVASLVALAGIGGCESENSDEAAEGELLFDLSPEQVEAIHEAYLPDEDLADTQARLTAPFNCDLYDDLCEQVGREAAIDVTARQVDLALEGVSPDELEAETRAWIDAAAKALLEAEDGLSEDEFRSSGSWAIRTKGDYRLRVRNGITTPLIGMRQAWTESQLQHKDIFGVWWAINGSEICVNPGVNEQVQVTGGGGGPTSYLTIESADPVKTCDVNESSYKDKTYHERNNGWENGGLYQYFILTADGCGTGDVNGVHMGICASAHSVYYY
jgi:hypothetical protein